ncbi:hypothetical protein CISIN_1g045653mg [Citrus sinensis]|uniref:Disease resistance protein At4g27190-like leucine-rich repeats domain-containing protein n=1 Tax=Citrus sinensis TaxID=2711 RepID=A0A067DZY1_CITSI|nr:hypothetical protein CISIN_1g045653mg [Citrus sinensis]
MAKVPCDAFPLLESLTLHNLINLERICIDRLKVDSFNELKTIKVESCDEIFAIGGEADVVTEGIFAQISCLSLGNLPQLTSFCREVKRHSISSNTKDSQDQSMTAITCSYEVNLEDKLDTSTTLFNDKVRLPKLEALELHEINVEKIWRSQVPAKFPRFQSLTRLVVSNCHKLKYLFSASMIRSVEQLQHLDICLCKGLLGIISEDTAIQVTPCFVFPRVSTLRLIDLPKLRFFYPGMHTSEWPTLQSLEATGCDNLKIFGSELSSFCGNIY